MIFFLLDVKKKTQISCSGDAPLSLHSIRFLFFSLPALCPAWPPTAGAGPPGKRISCPLPSSKQKSDEREKKKKKHE